MPPPYSGLGLLKKEPKDGSIISDEDVKDAVDSDSGNSPQSPLWRGSNRMNNHYMYDLRFSQQ
jgi:hypothetical protein